MDNGIMCYNDNNNGMYVSLKDNFCLWAICLKWT